MMVKTLVALIAPALLLVTTHAQQKITAQDYADIKQLYALSGQTLDNGADNGNAYARLFTADAVMVDPTGKTITGRDALATYARGAGKTPTSMNHFIYNVRVDPTPTGVNGMAYVVMATLNQGGQPATVGNGGQFHDELVKTAEGWRFKSRKFVSAVQAGGPGQAQPQPARPGQ